MGGTCRFGFVDVSTREVKRACARVPALRLRRMARTRRPLPCAYPGCEEAWCHLRCGRCQRVGYCSKEHQREHWDDHRRTCEEQDEEGASRRAKNAAVDRRTAEAVMESVSRAGVGVPADIAFEERPHKVDTSGLEARLVEARLSLARLQAAERLQLRRKGRPLTEGAEVIRPAYRRHVHPQYHEKDLVDLPTDLAVLREQIHRASRRVSWLESDLRDSRSWERHESGHETRDVLEHGERRLAFERRLGRKATPEDVRRELSLPMDVRRRALLQLPSTFPS